MKTAKTPKQRGIPATQNPKGKDVKWVEKTAILHETDDDQRQVGHVEQELKRNCKKGKKTF